MSNAVICDRCKKAIAEQSAFRVNTWNNNIQFGNYIATYYDLCSECRNDFENGFMRKNQTQLPESLMGDE